MHRTAAQLALIATAALLCSAPALAYIGPGAGITLLGALWAVVVAIGLAIGAVVLWPFRVLLRRRRKNAASRTDSVGGTRESHTDKVRAEQMPPANKSS
jgi:hypothetical protein